MWLQKLEEGIYIYIYIYICSIRSGILCIYYRYTPGFYLIYCSILSGYLVRLLINTFRLLSLFIAPYASRVFGLFCCSICSSYLVDLLLNTFPFLMYLLLRTFPGYLVYLLLNTFRLFWVLLLKTFPVYNVITALYGSLNKQPLSTRHWLTFLMTVHSQDLASTWGRWSDIRSDPKKCIHSLLINISGINLNEISISG